MSSSASVLYDAPGPRARVRQVVYSVVVGVVLIAVAWLVVSELADKDQLTSEKWKPFVDGQVWQTYILPGLRGTIVAALLSIVFALIVGIVFGLLRLSEHRVVRFVAGVVVEFARAIPVLILMIFLFAVIAKYDLTDSSQYALTSVVIALTVYNGSVIAEIVRSGIRSLPKGQTEAAVALGLRKGQMMRIILLPQAITAMLPAIVSQMVVALKDTALGYQITYQEIVRQGQQLGAAQQNTVPSLIVIAVIMIALNWSLTSVAGKLEKRLRTRKKGRGVVPAAAVLTDAAPGMDLTKPR
ncbi:amino acid ABC transporter permease [Nocardia sp. BMG51109]|uniref:amino acid ABC transporter permease n=1 Tax=Nocardia sp. BMG51109 TaxID=1056816 RepID=UPI000465D690|nr:amino acid ABC transporter permease [Nocardia sp. BMG51109]